MRTVCRWAVKRQRWIHYLRMVQHQVTGVEHLNSTPVKPHLLDFFYQIQRPSTDGGTGASHQTESIRVSDLAAAPKPGLYGLISLALAGFVFAIQLYLAKAKTRARAEATL
jgi:hypothetical protein